MKILVLVVGKRSTSWVQQGVDRYSRRIRGFLPLDEQRVRPVPFRGDLDRVCFEESRRVLKLLRAGDRLVLLDERGRGLDSLQFSTAVQNYSLAGCKRLVFCVGGPYGHGPQARAAADLSLSLSPMVMNHELARLLLYEQIYRALTIMNRHPYHH